MMKNKFLTLSLLTVMTLISTSASGVSLQRKSIHDPSVVYEPSTQYYYLFGTHRGLARSRDMMNWNEHTYYFGFANDEGVITSRTSNSATPTGNTFSKFFKTNMTKTVTIGGEQKAFGNFDVHAWSAAATNNYEIDGNMWAPDVVYNKKMQKWCLYFSINGDAWASSIALLTSDKINGPYVYQGPVVFSGFGNTSNAKLSYKKTDLELAIGTQSSLPSRYAVGSGWGRRYPNCIDPCVFYDEEGKLWMTYGSWSGGIWMLQLDEETGLRDYDVKYTLTGDGDGVTQDPYYGKKIAGGYYVSGEGSYIEHIGNYYYLFVTYGFMLSAQDGTNDQKTQGGYQMRVFRSEKPDGPYKDRSGVSAVYTGYQMNYGPNAATNRGVNIFGAYSEWGGMTKGEREQGHNSIIDAEDGRTYLIYHTRFQENPEWQWHAVRVHQVFQNEDGWLVAAPFEYTGEEVTNADIPTTQQVATNKIPGQYKLLVHRYKLGYTWGNQQTVTPVDITLHADGTVTGTYKGTWKVTDGTSYMTIAIGGVTYKGVMVNQLIEPNTGNNSISFTANDETRTVAFTGLASSGVTAWAYRSGDDPTGIMAIESDPASVINDTPWYDLQGRSVSTPTRKGVYIRDGKKVVVK